MGLLSEVGRVEPNSVTGTLYLIWCGCSAPKSFPVDGG